mgnify:CR=1 FL=1
MRFPVASLIVGVTVAISVALGSTGHVLPSVAMSLAGLLVLLVWLRLSDPKF